MRNPLFQALACLFAAAALYVVAGKYTGDVHDGIVALAGIAGTLWMRLPQGKDAPPPVASLLALVLLLGGSACSPASRQTQLNVAEVATQAATELGQGMLALYNYQLAHCVEDSADEQTYTICKMGVDQVWGRSRLAYAALRRTQDEYATALEKNELKAADFLEWFRISYCELKASAPPELVLPPVPGLTCGDASQ